MLDPGEAFEHRIAEAGLFQERCRDLVEHLKARDVCGFQRFSHMQAPRASIPGTVSVVVFLSFVGVGVEMRQLSGILIWWVKDV